MLDFLGQVPTRKRPKTAQRIRVSRELVNVAQGTIRSSIYLSTPQKGRVHTPPPKVTDPK